MRAATITEIKAITGDTVNAVGGISEDIANIDRIASSVAAAVEEQEAATREIARSVTETATAATEVTERIAEVSAEASRTDEQAMSLQVAASEVADNVAELRRVLVHVVRTATPEANRRSEPRYPMDVSATLSVGGEHHPAVIENISEGGFMAKGAPPAIAEAMPLEVRIDGVPVSLTAEAITCEHGKLRGRFQLAGDAGKHWEQECANLVAGKEPLAVAA